MLRRWLREPLVHFSASGFLLFAGYAALNPGADLPANSRRIELSEGDLHQLTVAWVALGRPAPTPEQLRSLVDRRVREEILYREALALGLDRGDSIVRRRLAQKMEFLADDLSAVPEPTREELRTWFDTHSERFASDPRITFRHLYFSPDRRGPRARAAAAEALAQLAGGAAGPADPTAPADPFMFEDWYRDRTRERLAADFGTMFAQQLFELRTGSWQGPIESGYGWHLVWLESLTPARVPAFDAVEGDVHAEWLDDQRAAARERVFAAMRARYDVVLPALPTDAAPVTAAR
jgi:peptidyl-prolyl cis-trans isomerase C